MLYLWSKNDHQSLPPAKNSTNKCTMDMFAWSKHECSPARFPEYLRNESSKIHEYKGATHNNLIVWKIVKLWNFMHVLSLDHVGILVWTETKIVSEKNPWSFLTWFNEFLTWYCSGNAFTKMHIFCTLWNKLFADENSSVKFNRKKNNYLKMYWYLDNADF